VRNKSHSATVWLCCFPWQIVVESPDRCVGLVGNYKTKVLFEQADSDDEGERPEKLRCSRTGCVRASKSSSILNFLGTHISMPNIIYYHCNVGQDLRPICNVGLEPRPNCFRFPISLFQSHSNAIVIIPFVQAACSTSSSTSAYRVSAEDYEAMPLFVSSKEN
jgi:hypothetical protein